MRMTQSSRISPRLADFAKTSLDQHYKFRVVDRKQFAP